MEDTCSCGSPVTCEKCMSCDACCTCDSDTDGADADSGLGDQDELE